jgi:hypothetical protein
MRLNIRVVLNNILMCDMFELNMKNGTKQQILKQCKTTMS